jgi:hypothetical protein
VRLLTPLAKPLRQARDGLLARLATADQDVSLDQDLEALRQACEGKEPPGLQARADRAVRDAHQAWYDTAHAHPEPPTQTVTEARATRVDDFLSSEGLG